MNGEIAEALTSIRGSGGEGMSPLAKSVFDQKYRRAKTTADWAAELGCKDIWIEARSSNQLRMEPVGEDPTEQEYIQSSRFALRMIKASERFIIDIGFLDMTKLRLGKAAADGVDLRNERRYEELHSQILGPVTPSMKSTLLLDDLSLGVEYRGLGLAKSLLGRALAYYDDYGHVLARSDNPAFLVDATNGNLGCFPNYLGFEQVPDSLFHILRS